MAQVHVRFLVIKPGASRTGLPRVYWQLPPYLRKEGYQTRRIPQDRRSLVDPDQLLAAAIAEATALNRWLDAKRAARTTEPAARPAPEPPRTVDRLIEVYLASREFDQLADSTKRGYKQCFAKISAWAGHAPVAAVDYDRIEKLRVVMKATPSFRNATLRVLRLLFGHAMRIGWVMVNPALRPIAERPERSGLVWPADAIEAVVAMADAMGRHSIGTAVALNAWLGQRQGDVLRLTRGIYRDGVLLIQQSKTGARVNLPVKKVPTVYRRVEQELARIDSQPWRVKPVQLIVDETTGRPYTGDRFRHVFAQVRDAAAKEHRTFEADYILPGRDMADPDACTVRMSDLQFMHLRHTAVVRLAEAGCEDTLIASVTGHSLRSVASVLSHYLVRTQRQAELAFEKRLAADARSTAPLGGIRQLFRAVRGSGGSQKS